MKEETMFQIYRLYESLYLAAARMEQTEIDLEIARARAEGPRVEPAPAAPGPFARAAAWLRAELREFLTPPSGQQTSATYWPPEI